MAKVQNDKSDTKKKGGEDGRSFRKNDADFHESEDELTAPSSAPVQGAEGEESEPSEQRSDSSENER